ncbi:MAG: hypothetical protein HY298_27365 [Verrucomicrobia bacterium]|nr:hypothetical protein [Verrucomicrobiota bacterium]
MVATIVTTASLRADFQGATHLMPFDEETINYNKTKADGPVARLQERIDKGEVKLKHDDTFGYLLALLEELKVPVSSQMLVFSKTSFQRERISPKTPRALFFNDDVYVGFIPGAPLLEVSTADPKLGGVFYTFTQTATDKMRFVRTDQCLECHASAKTMGVPGHLLRSFPTDEDGVVDLNNGVSLVNHRTLLEERWGGWYVTGTHGKQTHRGNLIGPAAFARQEKEPNYLGNLTDLSRFFPVSNYPRPQSDIVALMVLEHQTHMHNFITRLNYESTLALQQYGHINYLKNIVDAFLKYLLFTEEAPLNNPVKGNPEFAMAFENRGPRDKQGRSLREFDLQTRLFKYPCSYLIYSDAFAHLPGPMKTHLYQRLWDILTNKDSGPAFQKISADTKRAILEILRETKPDLPDYWREGSRTKS